MKFIKRILFLWFEKHCSVSLAPLRKYSLVIQVLELKTKNF